MQYHWKSIIEMYIASPLICGASENDQITHTFPCSLHWRHNEHDGVSNHQPNDCLLKRLFGCISKKTSKLRVTGLCVGNSPVTVEFPAQSACNAENGSIWWRHHVLAQYMTKALKRRHGKHTVSKLPIRQQDIISQEPINTLRPRQNGRHFPDDIFKWIFLNDNILFPTKISLKFVPRGPINNIPALVQIMADRLGGAKPLSEPMMVSLPTLICVTRPQWVTIKPYDLFP